MTPDITAETWLGAAACAPGSHTCTGMMPALTPNRVSTSAISFSHWGANRWKAFVANAMSAPAIDPALYQKRYPELTRLAEDNDINFVLRNIAWKCGEFLRRDKGQTVQADNTLTDDASIFADAARGDFTLKPNAPALKQSNFKPIPFKTIVLYKDEFRHSIPIKPESSF
jgi:hypothetical protein